MILCVSPFKTYLASYVALFPVIANRALENNSRFKHPDWGNRVYLVHGHSLEAAGCVCASVAPFNTPRGTSPNPELSHSWGFGGTRSQSTAWEQSHLNLPKALACQPEEPGRVSLSRACWITSCRCHSRELEDTQQGRAPAR